jgi:hypothetical protein
MKREGRENGKWKLELLSVFLLSFLYTFLSQSTKVIIELFIFIYLFLFPFSLSFCFPFFLLLLFFPLNIASWHAIDCWQIFSPWFYFFVHSFVHILFELCVICILLVSNWTNFRGKPHSFVICHLSMRKYWVNFREVLSNLVLFIQSHPSYKIKHEKSWSSEFVRMRKLSYL